MNKILKQRDIFFNRKFFKITEEGLSVEEKGFLTRNEYSVDFDNIGSKRLKTKSGKIWWVIGGFLLIVLAGLLYADNFNGGSDDLWSPIFYLTLGLACFVVFICTYKRSIFLLKPDNSNGIEFLQNKPSRKELEIFITELIKIRNENLEEVYGEININLPYEQNYNNQLWLKNNNVINKSEFKLRISKLERQMKKPEQIVGFNNTNNN